jgi:hypothetical protein
MDSAYLENEFETAPGAKLNLDQRESEFYRQVQKLMFHDEVLRNEQNEVFSKTTKIFNRVPELSANFPEPWLQQNECMVCNKHRFTAIFFYRRQNLDFEKNLASFYHINLKTFKYRPYITAKFTNFEPIAMKKISTIIDNMEVSF